MPAEARASAGGQARLTHMVIIYTHRRERTDRPGWRHRGRARAEIREPDILVARTDQANVLEVQHQAALLIELPALVGIQAIALWQRARRRVHVVERLGNHLA